METLFPVIVGFFLTTVLGGVLGTWLQQRSWDHQRQITLSEKELDTASEICQQISGLLDKRIYRMLRLYYALRPSVTHPSKEIIKKRLQDYDSVLFEWNDHINLNLALVTAYFGQNARDWLQTEVYEPCQYIGDQLEIMYRNVMFGSSINNELTGIESSLIELNQQIYRLEVYMMTQLRSGCVGRSAPNPMNRTTTPAQVSTAPTSLTGINFEGGGATEPEGESI